jgi:hypothetical protein
MPSKQEMWLIPKGEKPFAEFEGTYVEEKNRVLYWLGKSGSIVGDFKCYPSAIDGWNKLVTIIGEKDSDWRNKLFTFKIDKALEKYVVTFKPL